MIFIVFLLIVSGCISHIKQVEKSEYKKEIIKIDPRLQIKIKGILKEVEELAKKYRNLENFGIATMQQSIEIMDIGKRASAFLIDELYTTSNYNFKYWLVDMLGYLNDRRNIFPLLSIIEDENEDLNLRKRAIESIKEIGSKTALKKLIESYNIVKNPVIKEKIAEAIIFLSEK